MVSLLSEFRATLPFLQLRSGERDQNIIIEWVQKIADASDFTYGVRRMKRALNSLGYPVGKQRTRALMKEAGVSVKRRRKYKVTTNSDHQQPVFNNVLSRDFDAQKLDQAYVSDITYI